MKFYRIIGAVGALLLAYITGFFEGGGFHPKGRLICSDIAWSDVPDEVNAETTDTINAEIADKIRVAYPDSSYECFVVPTISGYRIIYSSGENNPFDFPSGLRDDLDKFIENRIQELYVKQPRVHEVKPLRP